MMPFAAPAMNVVPPEIVWHEVKDAESGEFYYYNVKTSETTWDRPLHFPFASQVAKPTKQPQPVAAKPIENTRWQIVSTDTGEVYYFNTETNLTTWVLPPDIIPFLVSIYFSIFI